MTELMNIESTNWTEIKQAMVSQFPAIHSAAQSFLNQASPQQSDCLRAYIRPDHGAVYFALEGPQLHYAEIASIRLRQLQVEWYELPDPEEAEAEFEAAHDTLVERIRGILNSALNDPQYGSRLAAWLAENSIRFTAVEYDDLETERDVEAPNHEDSRG